MSNTAILEIIKLASNYLDRSLLTYAAGVLKGLEIVLAEMVANEKWDINLEFNEPPQYDPLDKLDKEDAPNA